MSPTCPTCETELEWVDITGSVAKPTGSLYRCPGCGQKFTDRELYQPEVSV